MSSRKKEEAISFRVVNGRETACFGFLNTVSNLLECKSTKAKRLDDFPVGTQTLKKSYFIQPFDSHI